MSVVLVAPGLALEIAQQQPPPQQTDQDEAERIRLRYELDPAALQDCE